MYEKKNVEDKKNIKNLGNQIEKEKKEMPKNNNKYILLLNKYEILYIEINDLKEKIELMKRNNDDEKTKKKMIKMGQLKRKKN